MFYHLLFPLKSFFSPFNVFQYITFRSAGALITSLILGLILGYVGIKKLRQMGIGENIREDGPVTHYQKAGTPTMGGIFILGAIIISTLLWAKLDNVLVYLVLFSTVYLGALGFVDDYLKVKGKKFLGLKAHYKLLGQCLLGLAIGLYFYFNPVDPDYPTGLGVPFFKEPLFSLGVFYIAFVGLVIIGSSNAVNLTDGLDGLAIGNIIIAIAPFTVIVYLTGRVDFSDYLGIEYVEGSGELTIFCAAMIGAGTAFLWFNTNPAQVFMGDTGALALGGALGTLAVATKKEVLLFIVGGVFVIEAISVIVQWVSYRIWGKPYFKMAPIHHHFEQIGMSEQKIVVRFWIVGGILAIISLVTLKLR